MEFGSSRTYESCDSADEPASEKDHELSRTVCPLDIDDEQPKLKPCHFASRSTQIVDEMPMLLCAEDEHRPPSELTLSLRAFDGDSFRSQSTINDTPLLGRATRAKSDGHLLSEARLASFDTSDSGKQKKKHKKSSRKWPLQGIMKWLGRGKKEEDSVHVERNGKGAASPATASKSHKHCANTNVLAVRFRTLTEPANIHTGDAVICSNEICTATLSHLSQLRGKAGDEKLFWDCEFCGVSNKLDIAPEEVPKEQEVTYMTMPGRDLENGKAELGSSMEEALVIFCVDTSGSMCVTTPVPGKLHLRGHDELEHRRRLSINEDIANQYAPRERRDITYVSRLQSMQAAVDQQLTNLARSHPSQRVALITFSDEVVVIGDGRSGDMIVAGDRLANPDALTQIGAQLPLPSSIRESREILSRRVFSLEDSGQTALGPALLLSILLATRTPGSRVIICTDGLANKGIGSLHDLKTDEEFASSQVFYKDLGDIAMENGVTVSLVTIRGTECRVLELGQVADRTGGTVNVVDPLTITTEFSNILANPIIATNVVAKIVLPQQMYFCRESTPKSVVTVPVGNVTADSEISYEYGFLGTKKPTEYIPEKATSGNLQLPFQVQIDYTTCDGSRYLKVITKHHCVTKNRKEAESAMNFTVIGAHSARETASLAAEGKFAEARESAESSSSLLQKSSLRNEQESTQYRTLMENMEHLSDALPVVTHTKGGASLPISWEDDSEEESVCAESYISSFGSAVPGRIQSSPRQKTVCLARSNLVRQREISDQLACEILHARTSTDSAITSCSSWH